MKGNGSDDNSNSLVNSCLHCSVSEAKEPTQVAEVAVQATAHLQSFHI